MSGAASQLQSAAKNGASASEPVFVFGADLAGKHDFDTAAQAARLHGAAEGTSSGPTGSAYAIPCRNSQRALLGADVIANYTEPFLRHAQAHPDTAFEVARFGCGADGHDDATMARLFAKAPDNVRLPGLWLRCLRTDLPARLLLLDPGAHLRNVAWQERLQRYLSLNEPLWNVPCVELVSVGGARAIVANDVAAKELGLRHRVFGPNEARYGANAQVAAELHAIWYATHVLSISDFEQTAQPQLIRVIGAATRAGLDVDQIDASED